MITKVWPKRSDEMRWIAKVNRADSEIKRLLIYDSEEGVYLFGYKKWEDSPSNWDEWFESVEEAQELREEKYRVKSTEWQQIPDPMVNCQHDWLNSVRVKGGDTGTPEGRAFEKLEGGEWVDLP